MTDLQKGHHDLYIPHADDAKGSEEVSGSPVKKTIHMV